MSARHIALAAGGTGGHVFPALSLAEALSNRGQSVTVVTDARGDAFDSDGAAWSVRRIRASSPSKPSLLAKLSAVLQLALGVLDARKVLKSNGVEIVVGFGGYPSVPTVLAAATLQLPVVLHEQNAVLGRANRWLAGRAKAIATSFENTVGLEGRTAVTERTGNPVRPAVLDQRGTPYPVLAADGPISLLIFGGSLGARVLSDVVPAAIALLPDALRARIAITQQCRPEDLDRVRKAYDAIGQKAVVESFFDDIPKRLAAAHLVIARSGASTIAELAVIGRPAILVPYRHAMDDHQTVNAAALMQAGGAWTLPETAVAPETLAERLNALLTDPQRLADAAREARGLGVPDATDRLADLVLRMVAEPGLAESQPRETVSAETSSGRNERRMVT